MNDRVDGYVRGELTAAEARVLAQAALDSPALFDELSDLALVKVALRPRVVRFPRRAPLVAAALAAAATVLIWISPPPRNLKPVLEAAADIRQPVLLGSGLSPAGAAVFRGAESEGRAPRAAGSIISVEDGLANFDLGSLDGLAKGSELQAFRGGALVGRLQVITVFRDRARGRGLDIRPKDEVRVATGDHFAALLDQADAAFQRGGAGAAGQVAEAVHWGESAGVAPGTLAAGWNQLAALQTMRGEYAAAEELLVRAVAATGQVHAEALNNLGVLAELRGDRRQAESRYREALRAFAGAPPQVVESNLARVRGSR